MFCGQCGTRIEDGANFCPTCGANVNREPANCGTETGLLASQPPHLNPGDSTVKAVIANPSFRPSEVAGINLTLPNHPHGNPFRQAAAEGPDEVEPDDSHSPKRPARRVLLVIFLVVLCMVLLGVVGRCTVSNNLSNTNGKAAASKPAAKQEPPFYPSECEEHVFASEIARNPEDYEGASLIFSGKVLQVVESSDQNIIRLAQYGDIDKVVAIAYDPSDSNERILEGDLIHAYGTCEGLWSYEGTLGQIITVPALSAELIKTYGGDIIVKSSRVQINSSPRQTTTGTDIDENDNTSVEETLSYESEDQSEEDDDSQSYESDPGSYILPFSGQDYYDRSQLEALSDWELYIARNEIFARRGRPFANSDLVEYFSSKSWYEPYGTPESFDQEYVPNECERANADLILKIERERGSQYL